MCIVVFHPWLTWIWRVFSLGGRSVEPVINSDILGNILQNVLQTTVRFSVTGSLCNDFTAPSAPVAYRSGVM